MKFAKPRLIRFGTTVGVTTTYFPISDHNRSPLAISYEIVENRKRMADGTLRKQFIASKHKWSTSWDMLPGAAAQTVDKYWGANDIETFYLAHQGSFLMEVTYSDSSVQVFNVMFSSFSKTLQKRGTYDFYSVNVDLEEV
jgi:hypothetical protein